MPTTIESLRTPVEGYIIQFWGLPEHSGPGTEVNVVWGNPGKPQKEVRRTVAQAPYKEDKRRIDVTKI
jgi:hypothetical protein